VLDSHASSLKTDQVLAELARVLSPYVGATMAEASTRAHCQKLGLVGPTVDSQQVEALIAKLGSGLAVFVGRQKSVAIVEEMRRALAAAGGSA
jgi:hypothetical protein